MGDEPDWPEEDLTRDEILNELQIACKDDWNLSRKLCIAAFHDWQRKQAEKRNAERPICKCGDYHDNSSVCEMCHRTDMQVLKEQLAEKQAGDTCKWRDSKTGWLPSCCAVRRLAKPISGVCDCCGKPIEEV